MKISTKKLIFPALLVVLGFCLLAAGCTSSSSETPTPQVTAVTTTSPASVTPSSGGVPGSVTAVSYTALFPFFPDAPAGWTADDPTGFTLTDSEAEWSWATRNYNRKSGWTMITIQDSAYHKAGYWNSWEEFAPAETPAGYVREKTISGYPAWETYVKPGSYGTWIGINDRFMVYVSVEGGSEQDLNAFVNAINYNGIANLK